MRFSVLLRYPAIIKNHPRCVVCFSLKSPSWDVIDTCKMAVVAGAFSEDSSRLHFFSDPLRQGWPWIAVAIRPGRHSRAVRGVLCVDRCVPLTFRSSYFRTSLKLRQEKWRSTQREVHPSKLIRPPKKAGTRTARLTLCAVAIAVSVRAAGVVHFREFSARMVFVVALVLVLVYGL